MPVFEEKPFFIHCKKNRRILNPSALGKSC